MATIGQLITFCDFVKTHDVEIPRIQRDYTYGSGTEKTEEVLCKLLSDIYEALVDPSKELILDFVYGSKNNRNNFEPLDGQQRLTTLFLLHLYASWGERGNMPVLKFNYSTRDNTAAFCESITDLRKFSYDFNGARIDEQIQDCAFFRASFNDDPSIRSMLAVLVRIEEKFKALSQSGELTRSLTDGCRIRFYCLDFGTFGLSDDLYIKMNSRGKPLTEYEIFKSQLEKYIDIDLGKKDLKYDFGRKFDTIFTDLVWRELGMDKAGIDDAFIMLFRNILAIRNFTRDNNTSYLAEMKVLGEHLPPKPGEKRKTQPSWYIGDDDIDFIIDFFTVFDIQGSDSMWDALFYTSDSVCGEKPSADGAERIRLFKTTANLFRTACSKKLNNAERIMLYAEYYALKKNTAQLFIEDKSTWLKAMAPLRHIRNLVENSDDELSRPDFIHDILKEVETIIDGNIQTLMKSRFNTNQFIEEKEKASHPDIWEQLYHYENHDILRGSLSLMTEDGSQAFKASEFNIADQTVLDRLLARLEKIEIIFGDNLKNDDAFIRACLLSIGDFGQVYSSDMKYGKNNRMVGRQSSSWRFLMTKNSRFKQDGILKAIDALDASAPLSIRQLGTREWRYYASHKDYYQYTYLAYNYPTYGYYFIKDSNRSLEAYILQSTSCSDDNVMWKLLNRLLAVKLNERKIVEWSHMSIGNRPTAPAIKIEDCFTIDGVQEGWVIGNEAFSDIIMPLLQTLGYTVIGNVVIVPDDTDYIEYGLKLVQDIKMLNSQSVAVTAAEPGANDNTTIS